MDFESGPMILVDLFEWTYNFYISFESALRFNRCDHTHVFVPGSGPK